MTNELTTEATNEATTTTTPASVAPSMSAEYHAAMELIRQFNQAATRLNERKRIAASVRKELSGAQQVVLNALRAAQRDYTVDSAGKLTLVKTPDEQRQADVIWQHYLTQRLDGEQVDRVSKVRGAIRDMIRDLERLDADLATGNVEIISDSMFRSSGALDIPMGLAAIKAHAAARRVYHEKMF